MMANDPHMPTQYSQSKQMSGLISLRESLAVFAMLASQGKMVDKELLYFTFATLP